MPQQSCARCDLAVISIAIARRILSACLAAMFIGLLPVGHSVQAAAETAGAFSYLRDPQGLPATNVGPLSVTQALTGAQSQPLSLASGDLNQDGVPDLVVGYAAPGGVGILAVHPGNLDAFAPQSYSSWQAISQGQFPSPYATTASVFQIPRPPNFLAVGKLSGSEHDDVVAASLGDTNFYVLPGAGNLQFGAAQGVPLPAPVTSMVAGRFGPLTRYSSILVGVGGSQPRLLLYVGSDRGLLLSATYTLPAPATSIVLGDMDGDSLPDAVVLCAGQVLILHSAPTANPKLETLSLPVSASSLIVGSFIHDRAWRLQMAILAPDGSINIVAPGVFDPRGWTSSEIQSMWNARKQGKPNPFARSITPVYGGWHVIETLPAVAPFSSNGTLPMLYPARISAQGSDDIVVVNPDAGQMAMISHSNTSIGAATFAPGQTATRTYSSGTPVAALPLRVNVDARKGMVLLHKGDVGVYAMMPLPDPTFFVNRTDDPSPGVATSNCLNTSSTDTSTSCSLRQAVMKANATQGQDTIVLPSGTFQLIIPSSGTFDASTGHLDVNDSLNIVGQGSSNTIVQAANGDQVFSILDLDAANPDPSNQGPGITVAISNLSVTGGNGSSSLLGGGGIAWDAGTDGAGSLNLDSVVISGNSAPAGGGLLLSDLSQNPDGNVTISNSAIDNNTALFVGGGISVSGSLSLTLTNTQILNNQALDPNAAADGSPEQGGGLFLSSTTPTAIQILGGVISGNQGGSSGLGQGGGVWTSQALIIDRGTSIVSNTAGNSGGGIWSGLANSTDAVSVTTATIVSNHASSGDGGGVHVDNTNAGGFSVRFSRIFSNTASVGGNGVNNASGGLVTADDNWWGCNAGPTKPGCDQVQGVTPASIVNLSFASNPSALLVGTSAQLTASLQDPNSQFANNLTAFTNLPASIQNPVNGSLSNLQTVFQPNGTVGATFTATTQGTGSALFSFDNQSLAVSIPVEDFSLSVTPAVVSVNGDTNAAVTFTGTITPINAFAGPVSITCSVVPATGISVSCPSSVTVSGSSVQFTVTGNTTSTTPAGVYSISVTASAVPNGATGSDTRVATVQLDVANFTVVPAQSGLTVNGGTPASASDTLTLTSLGGFSGTITLSCTAPANQGIAVGCSPSSLPLSSGGTTTSTLSVSTSASTPTGQYPISISAVGGGITVLASVNLVVADFSVSISPAGQTVNATTSAAYTVTIATTTGFHGSVMTTCSAQNGSGITISPGCPTSVSLTPLVGSNNATATFQLNANTSSVTAGTNTLTASGVSGSLVHTANAQLAAANFSLASVPTSQTVNVGTPSSKSFTINASPIGGYSGQICLNATVSPAVSNAPTITFSPTCISSSGSSTMQVSTTASSSGSTPAGPYTVNIIGNSTINGTSVNITQTTSAALVVGDFALAGSPASVTVNAGSTSAPVTITGTPVNGFNGAVSFCPATVTGQPTGTQFNFSACSITVASNSTTIQTGMTITPPASTNPGTYNLTVAGNSGTAVHTVPVTLNVPGFSVGVSAPGSSQTIGATSTATFNLFGQSLGGFSGSVNLQATISPGQVNGVSGPLPSLSAPSISLSPSGSGQTAFSVTVPTSLSTPAASYTITVTAMSGNITQTSTLTLTVNPPPPTFTLTMLQTSQTVPNYAAATFQAQLTSYSGFNSNVTLSAAIISGPALPQGALFGFCMTCGQIGGPQPPTYSSSIQLNFNNPTPGPGGTLITGWNLTVSPAAGGVLTPGTYVIQMTASGGGVTVPPQNITLNVILPPTFTLTTNPSTGNTITVTQGQTATVTVTLSNFQNIPAGTVFNLSAPNLSSFGATSSFSPPSLTAPGTSTLTIGTANAVTNQSIDFEVEASGGTTQLTQAVTLFLDVLPAPPPDFSLSLSGAQSVSPGGTATFSDSATFINGFNGTVSISLSGAPGGANVTVSPGTFTASGSGSVTIGTPSTVTPGTYTLTLTGSGGGITHTATTSLTVNSPPPPPDFSVSISGAQSISPGATATFSDSASFLNGFTGTVSLSLSGAPAGANVTASPGAFSGSGSGSVMISTPSTVTPGTYTLTLTASGGGITHAATTSLTVNSPPPPPPPTGGCHTPRCIDQ